MTTLTTYDRAVIMARLDEVAAEIAALGREITQLEVRAGKPATRKRASKKAVAA